MPFISCDTSCNIVDSTCNISILQEVRMIHTKDHRTGYLFDPWGHLGPKRRKLMERSWAGLFREHILCELPIHKLAPFFHADFGRPTKELYTVLGVLIFQQMKDLSDEETVYQLAFNEQWHFALDITSTSDDAAYMSSKTLWNMRKIVTDNGLDQILFHQITDVLARVFTVDASRQRIDSVHIRSNMQCLGRIRIFAETIHTFLINLRRQHKGLYETVDQELKDRYISQQALSCFSMVKPSGSRKTLDTVSTNLFALVQSFCEHPEVTAMHSYKLMSRVLREQCTVTEAVGEEPSAVALKPPKEIPSDSLQNPSDPDATYDGYKGQGYQLQVMETYSDADDQKTRSQTLNLITHVDLQTACQSDAHALIPAIESAKEHNLAPDELLADSLYGSDDNIGDAQQLGTELIAPAMGSPKERLVTLCAFTFSAGGNVLTCPQGHAPAMTKHKKTRHSAAFKYAHCSTCSLCAGCPVKAGKKYYYLRYDDKAQRIARRRAVEQSDEFRERYRWRAGAEATMSELDRRTGIKHLRVRGFKAVRFCATLKTIGINILRATTVQMVSSDAHGTFRSLFHGLSRVHNVVKERFTACRQWLLPFVGHPHVCYHFGGDFAA